MVAPPKRVRGLGRSSPRSLTGKDGVGDRDRTWHRTGDRAELGAMVSEWVSSHGTRTNWSRPPSRSIRSAARRAPSSATRLQRLSDVSVPTRPGGDLERRWPRARSRSAARKTCHTVRHQSRVSARVCLRPCEQPASWCRVSAGPPSGRRLREFRGRWRGIAASALILPIETLFGWSVSEGRRGQRSAGLELRGSRVSTRPAAANGNGPTGCAAVRARPRVVTLVGSRRTRR